MLCLGAGIAAGSVSPAVAASAHQLVITAVAADQAEHPHTPELAEPQYDAGPETAILERHVLVLDHPKYGQLNGLNYLAGCETCPLALPDDARIGPPCHEAYACQVPAA